MGGVPGGPTRRGFLTGAAALAAAAIPGGAAVSRSAFSSPTAALRRPRPEVGSGFVTRQGQSLQLNGSSYRPVGFNLWRANVTSWNKPPNTGYLVNDGTTLADTLAAINAGGTRMNVFRTWFFQAFTLNSGVTDWSTFDKTLSVAAAAGFKVIACLQDEWNFEGQITKDATWFTSGYSSATLALEAVPYRQWVQSVVTRYARDTRIAMWELVNEADVQAGGTPQAGDVTILSNFVTDVAGLIKSIDPNHLVSVGVGGNGNAGTIGSDYQTIHAISSVDICSFHDYYGAANAGAFETNNGLNTRIPQAAAVNKPLYIGECGIHLNTTVAAGSNGGTISGIAGWGNPSAGVLAVASTVIFPASGQLSVAASGSTTALVSYTGISGNTFTGCSYVSGSPSGTVSTGGVVASSPASNSQAVRASYLNAKMSAQLGMQGVSGYLPWQFDLRGVGTDDYNYPPADPALAVMGAYC